MAIRGPATRQRSSPERRLLAVYLRLMACLINDQLVDTHVATRTPNA